MIESLGGLLSAIKQTSPVIFTGFAMASGIVLFGSGEFLATIGLNTFREANKPYIGGCFVLSVSIVSAQIGAGAFGFVREQILKWQKSASERRRMTVRKADLVKLTPDEKAYLAPYIFDQKTTQYFSMEDGVRGSLEVKGILYRASNIGDVDEWAYNLQPWAREHLQENLHLLDGRAQNSQRRNQR